MPTLLHAGPCPFSGTVLCPAGPNAWADYQGFCFTAKDDVFYQQYCCCVSEMDKVEQPRGVRAVGAPHASAMER